MQIIHDNDVKEAVQIATEFSTEPAPESGGETHIGEAVSVHIPSKTAFIPIARQAVDALSQQLQLPAGDRAAIKLAVGEACNNAVLHTRPPNAGVPGVVSVACRLLPEMLEIDVTNQGNGFHPVLGKAMPEAELLAESGRGMALMEMMMDSVEYLSVHGNTVVRMRKRRPDLSAAVSAN